jgi:homopolymeric O-antigen transport system permease protein
VSVLEKTAPEAAPVEAPARDDRVTTIVPATRLPKLELPELWRYRGLATTFVWRDIKVRYKQTFIGVAWVLIQPLLATGIFTLIFGRFAEFPSDDVPYPVFVFAGVLMWTTYFQPAFHSASGSIAGNKALITKVYFPRLLLPVGAVTTPLVDFVIVFPLFVGMILWFDVVVSAQALLFPLFVLLAMVTALAAGLLFTAAGVRYRDVPYAIPFVIQIWLFASPVFYSINSLDTTYQWIAAINPMTGAISGFRWALLGAPLPAHVIGVSVVSAAVLLVVGLAVFRSAEPRFADTI